MAEAEDMNRLATEGSPLKGRPSVVVRCAGCGPALGELGWRRTAGGRVVPAAVWWRAELAFDGGLLRPGVKVNGHPMTAGELKRFAKTAPSKTIAALVGQPTEARVGGGMALDVVQPAGDVVPFHCRNHGPIPTARALAVERLRQASRTRGEVWVLDTANPCRLDITE